MTAEEVLRAANAALVEASFVLRCERQHGLIF